jgi:hypothetical protein
MRKRSTVPFYNRRQALKQRDLKTNGANHGPSQKKLTWTTNTNCSSVSTATTTVTVTDCTRSLSSTSMTLPNTTHIGHPLPCLPMPTTTTEALHAPATEFSSSSSTCPHQPTLTVSLERQRKLALWSTTAQSAITTIDTPEVRKRAAAWDRVAYYTSAAPAQATGLSFLANLGDPRQSGTFD